MLPLHRPSTPCQGVEQPASLPWLPTLQPPVVPPGLGKVSTLLKALAKVALGGPGQQLPLYAGSHLITQEPDVPVGEASA